MCPSPSPSNVELRVFWSTETTVIPTVIPTGEGENHTSVSRFMTSSPYSELQQDRSTLHSPVGIAHTAA